MYPNANGCKSNQIEKSGSEFFVPCGNGSLFFDALKEVFDMVSFFVETFVKGCRRFSISLGRDAGLQAQPVQGPAEVIGVVSFIGEDGPFSAALHQIWSGSHVVALTGGQAQANRSALVVDQSMDLGRRSPSGTSNFLETSNFPGTEAVFVNFDAGRINRPQFSFRSFRELFKNGLPYPRFAPLFPAGVNGGVGSEDTQSTPGATFSKPEKQGLQYSFDGSRWPSPFGGAQYRFGPELNLINFFSSSSLDVSLG